MIKGMDNIIKGTKCSITKEQLLDAYNNLMDEKTIFKNDK